MKNKERFMMYVKVAERSEQLGIGYGDRFTRIMDIEHADNQFNLRLDDFIKADDINFVHDFCGIQASIDRSTGVIGKCFLPRFAGN